MLGRRCPGYFQFVECILEGKDPSLMLSACGLRLSPESGAGRLQFSQSVGAIIREVCEFRQLSRMVSERRLGGDKSGAQSRNVLWLIVVFMMFSG